MAAKNNSKNTTKGKKTSQKQLELTESAKVKNKIKELLKLLSVALWLMIIFSVAIIVNLVAFEVFPTYIAILVMVLIIFLSCLIIEATVF